MPGTTPVYGFPYPEPTDLVADYPALGQQLAEDIEAVLPGLGGLAPVAPTSIANTGGSASTTGNTTTFSAVTALSLNGVFNADYNNYRMIIQFTSVSADVDIFARWRAGTTDASGADYATQYTLSVSTSVSAALAGGNTNHYLYGADVANGHRYAVAADIFRPFATSQTSMVAHVSGTNGVGALGVFVASASHGLSTSYSGFSLLPSGGSITGSIAVYGYKK